MLQASDPKKKEENDLIKQILFIFQGVETNNIKLNHRENAYCLINQVTLFDILSIYKFENCLNKCIYNWQSYKLTKVYKKIFTCTLLSILKKVLIFTIFN